MRDAIIFGLYRAAGVAALPLVILYLVSRVWRDRRYWRGLGERFGFLPASFQRTALDSVWLHAVSVGEVLSAVELVRRVRAALPGAPVFLSCSTLAGREAAESRLAPLVDGIFYAPIDYVAVVRRVLRRIRPAVVVVLETEIWPGLYREVKRSGAGLVVINGRISDKAWPSYRRWAGLFRSVLSLPDKILVQSSTDASRYAELGAPAGRLVEGGNLKYDFDPASAPPPDVVRSWLESTAGPLWIAASTVGPEFDGDMDEDDVVLTAYRELARVHRDLRLLIAPRKPDRFDVVASKWQVSGLSFARRSDAEPGVRTPVMLLDSVGELGSLFPFADVVFMGGTLAHRGGHNVLEPAVCGKAVVVGPHLENFADIQRRFRAGGGFVEVADGAELGRALASLLSDAELRAEVGLRARLVAEKARGATGRAVEEIARVRAESVPRRIPWSVLRPLLFLGSRLWLTGSWLKRRLSTQKRLPAPVVSVGGITMGGAGKTPLVVELARTLRAAGVNVAVLTRGYRRRSRRPVVLAAGSSAPVEVTGDEAQIILRDGSAHLGIGADRWLVGSMLASELKPEVFLLDDGFQHWRLKRDFDIVVLDALNPFGGGGLFPAGSLREPCDALARADAVVIARAGSRRWDGLVASIRRYNPDAPVYYASLEPKEWINAATGRATPLSEIAGRRCAAFCGLGNPDSFRETLARMGIVPTSFTAYADHHGPANLARLVDESGASYLLTTEKDVVKLAPTSALAIPVLWLKADMVISRTPGDSAGIQELIRHIQTSTKLKAQ